MDRKEVSFINIVGIYLIANIINASIPFLLLPLLTTYLTPSDYGLISLFQVLTSAIIPFIGLNSNSALVREYFEKRNLDFPVYVTNALYILISSTIVIVLVFWLFGYLISDFTGFPQKWLWAVLAFAFGQKATEYILALWRVQQKAMWFGIFRITRTALDIGLSVFFIVILKNSWEGRIEGQVIAVAFFTLVTIYYLFREKWIKFKFNKAYSISALKFGVPLIPHVLGGIIITLSDRIFITKMVGLADMGLYSVGYQVGMIIGLLQNSFNLAWVPWFYEKLKLNDEKEKIKIVKITYLYICLIIMCVVIVTILAPPFFDIFLGKEFSSAKVFVVWIAIGFAFNGMYKMVANYIFYLKKIHIIATLTFITAGINLCLNYFLIKLNGAVGAAQATTLSFLFQFILVWIISARMYKMPWFYFIKPQ